ncbi:MAG: NAD-dependent malic enzyme [Gammaproteobacteria bacterium]
MTPQLNKGTAFTDDERQRYGLRGKLPIQVETLKEQIQRCYAQFSSIDNLLRKNIFLNSLHDRNQVLFYRLVSEHLSEMMPTIYTPIVGNAVKQFSREFRQPRGLYVSYPEIDHIDEILENRSNPDIELIVVTDGEGVLGIGDQGVGGMDIPVAKLMVYTLCGGINPMSTLPILLDVGTNNQALLDDPMYLGWRHKRISGAEYDVFIEKFIAALERKFPQVFLHWEDFGRANAQRYLSKYQQRICTFNDDIQGTGIVTLAALLAGVHATQSELVDQRIVIYGAGTAGCGIANEIFNAMQHQGIPEATARNCFWLIDRYGLIIEDMDDLTTAQQRYARNRNEVAAWQVQDPQNITLEEVVKHIKPTVLIGCSAQTEAFNRTIIEEMHQHVARPIILPLSNPTEKAEATPSELLHWTNGQALVATGSPFDAVEFEGRTIRIAQCNNALVFPGIGLGILAVKASFLTDNMIWAACQALSETAPILKDPLAPLLPSLDNARKAARNIAKSVAEQAKAENLARENIDRDIDEVLDEIMWHPEYLEYFQSVEEYEASKTR